MEPKVSVCITTYNEEELIIRALDSIPTRDDIEIILVEDCSTDNTYKNILDYISTHKDKNIKLFHNDTNMGYGFGTKRCYDNSSGKWIVELGSDDYFLTNEFSKFIDEQLDDNYDLVYFDLIDNNNRLYNSSVRFKWDGAVKFIRRAWLGDLRAEPNRYGWDIELSRKMWALKPKVKFTSIIISHWNYPKTGSLSWLRINGKIDSKGNKV